MNREFLELYNDELRHIRERAAEFAAEYPKVAGRLALDKDLKDTCPDPFVERLLEGFAYLSARVRLKLDAEYPRFTEGLLETVMPHYLGPTPSMGIVKFKPLWNESSLEKGVHVPRGTLLETGVYKEGSIPCHFKTAHEITLYPFELVEAEYGARNLPDWGVDRIVKGARAALRLKLRIESNTTPGFGSLTCNQLALYFAGDESLSNTLFEQVLTQGMGVIIRDPLDHRHTKTSWIEMSKTRHMGYEPQESLLPCSVFTFEGYRQIKEHFACPRRSLFLEVTDLNSPFQKMGTAKEIEIIIPLKERRDDFIGMIQQDNVLLYATPVINLFERRCDRIELSHTQSEFHLVVDKVRPHDYEIYGLTEVRGIATASDFQRKFQPFYLSEEASSREPAFYVTRRTRRALSARERRFGTAASYLGGEIYLQLVDAEGAPFSTELDQLAVRALVTNRHLPALLTLGVGTTDLKSETAIPVSEIRFQGRPTPPNGSLAEGRFAWRAINHLSLNYLSLIDRGEDGAAALREMLRLYAFTEQGKREIEGLRGISSKDIVRRVPGPGPVSFAKGLEITLMMDEKYFEGAGSFLFAATIERFLSRYVTMNGFVETKLATEQRKLVHLWPAQIGLIHQL